MRIPSGKTDQVIYFVAVDSTDLKTRKTGLSGFTVYRSRNGGAATLYTTPTITELSAANMPGVYALTVDEDTTISSTSDSEEYVMHITVATMAPVTRTVELYRREVTTGNTLSVSAAGRALSDVDTIKTQTVTASGGVTFPASTLASTTNITAASGVVLSGVTHTGAVIPTVSAVTGLNAANLDATITSRMATYTQPTGFLAATFPSTVASPTNITAASGITLANGAQTITTLTCTGGVVISQSNANTPGLSVTGNGTGAGILSTSGAGATGDGIRAVAGSTNGHGITGVKAGTGADLNCTVTPLTLAKTTNITGFNDIAATAIVSSGAITTSGGAVSSVGSVSGAVGSVTAAVTVGTINANVITSTSIAADAITAAKVATGAIDADALATDAVAEIADGVWDEVLSGHLTAGSTGNALNAAGAAGDPWAAALPGAYGVGTAGKIVGDNLDASVSSRASQTSLDTVDDYIDTEIAAIKAKTDQLTFTVANQVDSNVQYVNDTQVQGNGSPGTEWGPV